MIKLNIPALERLLSYDPETGTLTWRVRRGGKARAGVTAGGPDQSDGYIRVRVNRANLFAHRIAWALFHKSDIPDGMQIDHINGDRTDNRIANLRLASHVQNLWNGKARSALKGASFHKPSGLWRASIKKDNVRHYLGYFGTAEEAHEAYKEAAKRLHGDFARWK